jgi:hypothetical protein
MSLRAILESRITRGAGGVLIMVMMAGDFWITRRVFAGVYSAGSLRALLIGAPAVLIGTLAGQVAVVAISVGIVATLVVRSKPNWMEVIVFLFPMAVLILHLQQLGTFMGH